MPLTSDEVENILRAEKEDAIGVNSQTLSAERKTALDYYMGDMSVDMPSPEGRSSAVSSDVADTVEGLMAPLMEIFAATEEVVRFEPVGPEDVKVAAQETDYVNHIFMQKNNGFLTLYSFIKDALLSKIGLVKVYWDKYEREERETYENQTDDTYQALLMAPGKEVVDGSHSERLDDNGLTVHSVTLVNKKDYACAKVISVPPEEFGINKSARCIKDASYIYHEPHGKTEADLIRAGFDAEQVRGLESLESSTSSESASRDSGSGDEPSSVRTQDTSTRQVRVTEHYKLMDYEQNDKPSLYRITTGGDEGEILERKGKPAIDPIDFMPFAAATPIILTHRFFGRSIADLVIDLQRIKTALIRALLDNAYLANNQRMEVALDFAHERTIDDLLSVNRPGGLVRTKKPGGLVPIPNQPLGPTIFPMVEYIDATREWRTGVTRQGQGLDANSLQNQSATAVNQIFTAAQARVKLIARIIAETGVRDMFALLHATIRKHDSAVNTVRLRNEWVTVDPRNWKTRDDMTINIALGTGSKPAQLQGLQILMGAQKEAVQIGMVTRSKFYNTARDLVSLVRPGADPTSYFVDPMAPPDPQDPPLQPPEDPKKAETAAKVQEGQQKIAIEQAKGQNEMQSAQMRMALEDKQAQTQVATENAKQQNEALLKEQDFNFKRQLAMMNHQIDRAKSEQQMRHAEFMHNLKARTEAQGAQFGDVMKNVGETLAQHQQRVQDALQSHAQHVQTIVASAPKRVVRDKNNRIVAIEPGT